jgi:TonB family protein
MAVGVQILANIPEQWRQWEGQVIEGGFPLRQYVGSSDHSAVFLTERGQERRKAAIKLVASHPENTKALISGWERARALGHPHLVGLYETGTCRLGEVTMGYVVMEACEEDLSQILPHRALTSAEATEMLQQIVDVISYLHGKGMAHGRIKPSNILASGEQVKLSADSLRKVGDSLHPADTASIYDAPEKGTTAASLAADMWSLGVTVVEALSQQPPRRDGKTAGEPLIPAENLPAPFGEIARHCLQVDPGKRWRIDEVSNALKPAANTRPEPVVRRTSESSTSKPASSRRFALPIVVAVALVVLLAGTKLFHRTESAPSSEERTSSAVTAGQPANGSSTQTSSPAPDAAGSVAHEVVPDVPLSARRTITGTIRVRVKVNVDPAGNVTKTAFETRGPSEYFARLAQQSASAWKFVPPQAAGQPSRSEWSLTFEFSRAQTRAVPKPISR